MPMLGYSQRIGTSTATELKYTRRFREVPKRKLAKATGRADTTPRIAIRVLGIPVSVLVRHRYSFINVPYCAACKRV